MNSDHMQSNFSNMPEMQHGAQTVASICSGTQTSHSN